MLILIIAATAYVTYNSGKTTKVGSTTISIPEGYHVKNITNGTTILKSKKTKLTITEENKTIDKLVEDYKNKHEEDTVKEGSVKIADQDLKTLTLKDNDGNTVRTICYYQKDGKNYQMVLTGNVDTKAMETIYNSTSNSLF